MANNEELTGKIKVIIFRNEENFYSVAKVEADDSVFDKYITIVGHFPSLELGSIYNFKGEFTSHYKYGNQFEVSQYKKILPSSKEGIIKYLSSPLFPGIGIKKAEKIVTFLGDDAILKIKKDASIIYGILNIKDTTTIIEGLKEDSYFEEAVQLFVTQGLSIKTLLKIKAIYKDKMNEIILENPYHLIEDIDGISFKTIDAFALSLNIDIFDERRIKAAILYSIEKVSFNDGGTFTSSEMVFKETTQLIKKLDLESFYYFLNILNEEEKIVLENEKLYSKKQYEAETSNAKYLTKFIKRIVNKISKKDIVKIIRKIEEKEAIKYDKDQIEAVYNCINSGLSIITGGPGTGKTTIVKALVTIYKELLESKQIFLCAPTGRASKRLSDLTGFEATTIHRLLKWNLDSNTFSMNKSNPLVGDLLIIDEFSMVDNLLLFNLLNATSNFSQIVFIGDDDQLPSVSQGNVLKDLLDTNLINTIKLTKIYRQKNESNIISLAHNIKNSQPIIDDLNNDVIFYNTNSNLIREIVLKYIEKAILSNFTSDDIQVLAPMYLGVNGIDNFNELLQQQLNPKSENKNEYKVGRKIYRENDKILQLKNQAEDDVYNGDIGKLIEIRKEINNSVKFVVDFDGNYVEFGNKEFINITHAYCISIHKSQGSEYPLVIMPMTNQYQSMLIRNLIYTGITRAKEKLVIIGDYNAFNYGINNINYKQRKTNLTKLIEKYVNN